MRPDDQLGRLMTAFERQGFELMNMVKKLIAGLPKGDQSGWYYIEALAADTSDGRKQATVKPKNAAAGAGNPALGPLVCLRSYTPVVGHRVLVRWVAGDRADGVIEG